LKDEQDGGKRQGGELPGLGRRAKFKFLVVELCHHFSGPPAGSENVSGFDDGGDMGSMVAWMGVCPGSGWGAEGSGSSVGFWFGLERRL